LIVIAAGKTCKLRWFAVGTRAACGRGARLTAHRIATTPQKHFHVQLRELCVKP
jgi:hypothetical protein